MKNAMKARKGVWGTHTLGLLSGEKTSLLTIIPRVFEEIDSLNIGALDLNGPFLRELKNATEWLLENMSHIIKTHSLNLFRKNYKGEGVLPRTVEEMDNSTQLKNEWDLFQSGDKAIERSDTVEVMRDIFEKFRTEAPGMPRWRKSTRQIALPISEETINLHTLIARFYRGIFTILEIAIPDITDQELQIICANPKITIARMKKYLQGIESKSESFTTTEVAIAAVRSKHAEMKK